MHLKRYRLLVSTLLSLASIAPAAEETTASAIAAKHYQALVADMSAYVEANPAATDLEEALDAGLQAAYLLEDTDRMLWFTRRKFDVLKVQEPLPVQDLAQTAMIYAQFASQGGSKDLLKGFLEELKTIATKSDCHIFPQVIQQVEGIVNKPGVGEVLEIKGIST